MTFTEKHSILNNQLVGDEDELQVAYLELLQPLLEAQVARIKQKNKESKNKWTFKQTLQNYGVDTSEMDIEVGD